MKISTKQNKTLSNNIFLDIIKHMLKMFLVQAHDGPQSGPRHRHLLLPPLQGAAAHTQGDQVSSSPRAVHYYIVTNIEMSCSVFNVV